MIGSKFKQKDCLLMSRERAIVSLTKEQLDSCLREARRAANLPDVYGCTIVDHRKRPTISLNDKQYVQIKVVGHINPNKKVQLHQLVAWTHPDPVKQETLRVAIREGRLEISHLCKQKSCMTPDHMVAESCAVNKSRNGCIAVIQINGDLHACCKHQPRCIPTAKDIQDALVYVV